MSEMKMETNVHLLARKIQENKNKIKIKYMNVKYKEESVCERNKLHFEGKNLGFTIF